jgi:bifunctional DNase/RNase
MLRKMEVKGLLLDPFSNTPVVVLKDSEDKLFLPIWIGVFEANAIALRMENVQTPRPLTHDLVQSLLEHLNTRIERIVINDLQENTFYARIFLVREGESMEVDSRPSDALALALRSNAEIFVEDDVLEKSRTIEVEDPRNAERLKKWLEDVDPDELGKYRM